MIRLLATLALSILGNAVGLVMASLLIDGFSLSITGLIVSVLVFTVAQSVLAPFVLKLSIKYLPALRGGIALVTILAALLVTSLFTSGLQIVGLSTWILAPLIIWVTTIVAGILLPMVIFKEVLAAKTSLRSDDS